MALSDLLSLSQYSTSQIVITALGTIVVLQAANSLRRLFLVPIFSPLRELPGPETYDSIFWGNLKPILNGPSGVIHEEWFNKYGPTITYRGFFSARRLCTIDTRALNYILTNAYDFPKPEIVRRNVSRVFGPGVLFAEGADHHRQRKILNPSFGPAQLRDLMPIFYRKAFELRDIWLHELQDHGDGKAVDILPWLTRVTLDIIGLAGFDYSFESLSQGETDELIEAFSGLFQPGSGPSLLQFLSSRFPILTLIPTERSKALRQSRAVLSRIGNELVQQKKQIVLAGQQSVEKKSFLGRDLLTAMIKANMAVDVRESERLTDEEVVGQITTMMIAGHETTSTSLTWLMGDLAKPENQHIQDRLRAELLTIASDEPTIEELNALPYLDAVVRENLRKNTVVDSTIRSAAEDAVIPVAQPFVDRNGVERHEFRIQKGDHIFIPILCMNRDRTIWGEDAHEFRPERWLDPNSHPRASEIPGVFGNQLSFLGGPRACIGYRMALIESKVLIFTLLRSVQFKLSDPTLQIDRKSSIVTRPVVKQEDGSLKSMMPLLMKPVRVA